MPTGKSSAKKVIGSNKKAIKGKHSKNSKKNRSKSKSKRSGSYRKFSHLIFGSNRRHFNNLPGGFEVWQESDRAMYAEVTQHLRTMKVERTHCAPIQMSVNRIYMFFMNLLPSKNRLAQMEALKRSKVYYEGLSPNKIDLDF